MTQWIEPFVQVDEKNWTLFQIWLQEMIFFFEKIWLTELIFWLWLTELNFFFEFDSQNWTFLKRKLLKELNSFFWYDSKNWTLFSDMTQRIELLFSDKTRRIELLLLNTTQQSEPFFYWLKELKFFQCDSKSLFRKNDSKHFTLLKIWLKKIKLFFEKLWLTEWNPSFQFDSKNWTLFNIWLEELNIFSIELFQYDSKDEIFPILQIWLFWWNESNIWTLFEHDSKNWTFFHLIHIIEPYFSIDSQNGFFRNYF